MSNKKRKFFSKPYFNFFRSHEEEGDDNKMKNKYCILNQKGGISMAVNDSIQIISSNYEYLNGQKGTVTAIISGEHGTEVKVLLESGYEAWIDADCVFFF
jgi:hypothetical protein